MASEQSQFFCDKIEGNCPYVDLINTSISKKNDEQLTTLSRHYQSLLNQQSALELQSQQLQSHEEYNNLEYDLQILTKVITQLDRK